jgi:excinuclease ABC subunit A
VGLDYLTLSRGAGTLSGARASASGWPARSDRGLTGVLYVLDEPSIGLHQRDNDRLLRTLRNLRDQGNTVIVVEHDEEAIRAADYVFDFGPGAGVHGGRVVAQGTPEEIAADPASDRAVSVRHACHRGARRPAPEGNGQDAAGGRGQRQQPADVTAEFPLGASSASPASRAGASRR